MVCQLCVAVLALVNAQRAAPLTYSPALAHLAATPGWLLQRARASGCNSAAVAENTAWGPARTLTPARAVRAWLHSPPHRAIMLSPRYRFSGVHVARHGASVTYTQDFASHCAAP